MVVQLSVTGGQELKAVIRRMRAAEQKGMIRELRKGMKAATDPAVADVKAAILAVPIKGAKSTRGGGNKARAAFRASKSKRGTVRGSTGLRASIARSIKAEIRTGAASVYVRIKVFTRQLPEDQRSLPRHIEKGHWRHPVWGDVDVWVDQYGQEWFAVTLKTHGPNVRREVIAAMRAVANQIEG